MLKLFEQLDAFRRPDRLENFLLTCEADKRGRLGHADTPYPQAAYLREAFASARAITAHAFVERGLEDPAIAEAQRQERIKAIGALRD